MKHHGFMRWVLFALFCGHLSERRVIASSRGCMQSSRFAAMVVLHARVSKFQNITWSRATLRTAPDAVSKGDGIESCAKALDGVHGCLAREA